MQQKCPEIGSEMDLIVSETPYRIKCTEKNTLYYRRAKLKVQGVPVFQNFLSVRVIMKWQGIPKIEV